MKPTRILSLGAAAVLLLLTFAGCAPERAKTSEPVDPVHIDRLMYDELTPTDTLVLYIPVSAESQIKLLIDRYKELYDVEVEVVRVEGSYEEYAERVANDLAGGTGPDVLFFNYLYLDIAKAALNHNFLDLTDILPGTRAFLKTIMSTVFLKQDVLAGGNIRFLYRFFHLFFFLRKQN